MIRKVSCITLAVVLTGVDAVIAASVPSVSNADRITDSMPTERPSADTVLYLNPVISAGPVQCCGGSMSASAQCIPFRMRNPSSSAVTYTTKFVGKKIGACIKYEDQPCSPGMICIPKCIESAPPIDVAVSGPNVTVPARTIGAEFTVMLNGSSNTFYLPGATVQVSTGGKTYKSSQLPQMMQCVN